MKISGLVSATLMGGLAVATLGAPAASAEEVCSAAGVANTVNTVTGSAQEFLGAHPGAGEVLYTALRQSPDEAAVSVRDYFSANPLEYLSLRGILAPIGDVERQCDVAVLPPTIAAAYNQFMAG